MKTNLRIKADAAKKFRCKNLIVVLENPKHLENVGSVLRNIDALGAEKLYVVDGGKLLPDDWQAMRGRKSLNKISASAVKWTFVRRFSDTQSCIAHLKKKLFMSVVTSPHLKGKENVLLEEGIYTQKRLAVWFGNESRGVSKEAIDSSEFCINMRMSGIIESLNLGTSTGIVLYEIVKQRHAFEKLRKIYKELDELDDDLE